MRKLFVLLFVTGLYFFHGPISFGQESVRESRLEQYFNILKDRNIDYRHESSSDVEEEIFRSKLYREFPADKYIIQRSVEYHLPDSLTTIGELDLVVIERATHTVVLVVEVKRSPGKPKIISKAKSQMARLRSAVKRHSKIVFEAKEKVFFDLQRSNFTKNFESVVGGINGKLAEKFQETLDITPIELEVLKSRLAAYQMGLFEKYGRKQFNNYNAFLESLVDALEVKRRPRLFKPGCSLAFG